MQSSKRRSKKLSSKAKIYQEKYRRTFLYTIEVRTMMELSCDIKIVRFCRQKIKILRNKESWHTLWDFVFGKKIYPKLFQRLFLCLIYVKFVTLDQVLLHAEGYFDWKNNAPNLIDFVFLAGKFCSRNGAINNKSYCELMGRL